MQLFFTKKRLFTVIEYPERYKTPNLGKSAGILFGALFGFLILYKPFGMYEPELKFNYLIICTFHALSPSLIVYAYFRLLNYYRSARPQSQEWTLFKELHQIIIVLFLIGIASFLMRNYIYNNPDNWSLRYFGEEMKNCYLAGGLFCFQRILATFYFQSKAIPVNTPQAHHIDHLQLPVQKAQANELFIHTQVKQEDFSFNPNHLLFVKADGNYIELTLNQSGNLTTELKRISLRQFELQLTHYPFLFRCHRAYLINLNQIEKISGNSQGYLVSFQLTTVKVPVSRAQLNNFDTAYKQIGGVYSA